MLETKAENIQLRIVKAHWTEASSRKVVHSWLRLSTSRQVEIRAVCAQDDSMAIGARKAFEDCPELGNDWRKIPFLGCDGLPKTGQEWLARGLLTATIYIPPNADRAIEMMAKAMQTGTLPAESTFVPVKSFPTLDVLARRATGAGAGKH